MGKTEVKGDRVYFCDDLKVDGGEVDQGVAVEEGGNGEGDTIVEAVVGVSYFRVRIFEDL